MKNISGALVLLVFTFYSFTTPTLEQDDKKNTSEVIVIDTLQNVNAAAELAAYPIEEIEIEEVVSEQTKASYYHDKFNGKMTASGEVFDNKKLTAAHKTLPFGTKVRVTNIKNKRSVVLTITDRGPFVKGREIDLSKQAFIELGDTTAKGILNVKIERLSEVEN